MTFKKYWVSIFKKRKKLSEIVEDNEPLAKYIFSRKHFSKKNKRVVPQAFMPRKNENEISVFRNENCPEDCMLKIGKKIGENRSTLRAYCSVLTKDVRAIPDLKVESDTSKKQHRRHANIIICNYNDAKTKKIAKKLADIATKNESLKIFEPIKIL